MSEHQRTLSVSEIAALAEVGLSAVSNWRRRHADFPTARMEAELELFGADEIADWLDQRTVPGNLLKAGEPAGSSYGQRFRRNLGGEEDGEVAAPEHAPDRLADFRIELWRTLDRHRSAHDPSTLVTGLLALLWAERANPQSWSEILSESVPDRVRERLEGLRLPGHPDTPALPAALTRVGNDSSTTDLLRLIGRAAPLVAGAADGQLSGALIEQLEDHEGRRGAHLTPSSLVRLMVELVDPEPRDRVYDPFVRSGELLAAAHSHRHGTSPLCGLIANDSFLRLSTFNIALHGGIADLRRSRPEPWSEEFPDQGFDVVLANPPFNVALPTSGSDNHRWPYGPPPRANANFGWLQQAAIKTAPNGRAAVLLPNSSAFDRGAQSREIRRRMVDAGVVECVIALPPGLFTSTKIATTLWILRGAGSSHATPDVLLIDATGLASTTARNQFVLDPGKRDKIVHTYRAWRSGRDHGVLPNEFARSVDIEDIHRNNTDLDPQHYLQRRILHTAVGEVAPTIEVARTELGELRSAAVAADKTLESLLTELPNIRRRGDRLRRWKEVRLDEIVKIVPGPSTAIRTDNPADAVPIVLPRNVGHGRLVHDRLDGVAGATAARMDRYRLEAGDIVSPRTGTLGRFARVRADEAGWLVGPGCVLLRPLPDVDAGYLTHHLRSSDAYEWLKEHAAGSVIPHITRTTLGQMPVALPPIQIQTQIAALLDAVDDQIFRYEQIAAASRSFREVLMRLIRIEGVVGV